MFTTSHSVTKHLSEFATAALKYYIPTITLATLLLMVGIAGCDSSPANPLKSTDPSVAMLGDQAHFDPIAAYDAFHKLAGPQMQLVRMDLEYVRSDGTLDLTASYDPNVDYTFAHKLDAPPPSMPPVGVRGVTTDPWYEEASFYIKKDRVDDTRSYGQQDALMPAPTCSLRTLWSIALEKGAQKDAVAIISIRATGYNFRIDALKVNLDFDLECHLKTS